MKTHSPPALGEHPNQTQPISRELITLSATQQSPPTLGEHSMQAKSPPALGEHPNQTQLISTARPFRAHSSRSSMQRSPNHNDVIRLCGTHPCSAPTSATWGKTTPVSNLEAQPVSPTTTQTFLPPPASNIETPRVPLQQWGALPAHTTTGSSPLPQRGDTLDHTQQHFCFRLFQHCPLSTLNGEWPPLGSNRLSLLYTF